MARSIDENLNALIDRVGKVRRWLVAMAILKVAALCVLFVVVYVVGYSLLDHHYNFGVLGRVMGLALLVGAVGILLYGLVRLLLVHVSYSGAANYIEERNSFDQQLVAAVEYYENRDDYPYSKTLAEQLVMRVCRVSQGLRFDATIDKWRGYVLAGVALVGLAVLCTFIGWNLAHIRPYLARLAMPMAKIEPVTLTSLVPITGDIVASTDSEVDFAALIEGRTPESGELLLEQVEPAIEDTNESPASEEIVVEPNIGVDEKPRLEATKYFLETGRYQYKFKAGAAATEWQSLKICDPPEIESISAEITLPGNANPNGAIEPYIKDVNDNVIEVVANSEVRLRIEASCPVSEIGLTGLDGEYLTGQRDSEDSFTFEFEADRTGALGLKLISEDGLPNKEPTDIQVVLRTDEPPEFELLSPDGDYLATNVSSVPIVFEVKDDFGLASAELCLEIPSRDPMVVKTDVTQGIMNCTCKFDLELEDYNLNVGDSILFYARATDVDTGIVVRDRNSSSEIYFIEIRPYRQFLHPKADGGSGQGAGGVAEDLLTILEYTRAAIKKTWAIASKASPTSDELSKLDSIGDDLEYCAMQLTDIRDDPDLNFTDQQKGILSSVLGYFEQAQASLRAHRAASALEAEKDAYTILRKFVDEMNIEWSPPPKGGGEQPKTPDKVKLQEASAFRGYEKERIEEELKKIEQKIDKLQNDQKNVKMDFEKFLKEQAKVRASEQADQASASSKSGESESSDGKSAQGQQAKSNASKSGQQGSPSSSGSSNSDQSSDSQSSSGQGKGQSQGKSSEQSSEGQKSSSSGGQGEGQSQSKSGSPSQQGGSGKQPGEGQSQGKEGQGESASEGKGGSPSQQGGSGKQPGEGQSQGKEGQGESASEGKGGSPSQQGGSGKQSGEGQSQSQEGQSESASEGKAGSSSRQGGSSKQSSEDQNSGSPDGQGKSQSEGKEGQSESGSEGEGSSPSQQSGASGKSQADQNSPNADSQGKSDRQSQDQKQGDSRADSAAAEARMRMFQAKERQLQQEAEKLRQELQQIPKMPTQRASDASKQTQDHIQKAISKMEQFQERLDESRYEPTNDNSKATEAVELLDSAEEQLAQAKDALGQGTAKSPEQQLAEQAQKMAEQLAEDADSLDKSLSPVEQREMQARLEAAKELLKKMAPAQWAKMQKGGGSGEGGTVYTMDSYASKAATARAISRQFWSIALEAKKGKQKTVGDEPSDIKFREAEIEFFKNAAKYDRGRSKR